MGVTNHHPPVVFQTGFRIFFLGAVLYSIISMAFWLYFYVLQGPIFVAMPLTVWHAHEMIFGFSMAVIAGFLLTAVMNWTGLPTLSGRPLMVLFALWLAARILAFMPASMSLWPLIVCDSAFILLLTFGIMRPIIKTRQWHQSAVFSKLFLLLLANGAFYWSLITANLVAERKALRFSVYMIVSLIFTIGRRILPFFIERGVGYPVTLRNSRALDLTSMVLILAFSLIDVFLHWPQVVMVLSILLVLVHGWRLAGWYTPGIWKKPLLWVLFVGYLFLIVGFVLKACTVYIPAWEDSTLHAFTAGGIGIFIIGMMARVSWGHTGRNVAEPLPVLSFIFILMTVGALMRVFFTLGNPKAFAVGIGISQILWMGSFLLFLFYYLRVLTSARPDGKPG